MRVFVVVALTLEEQMFWGEGRGGGGGNEGCQSFTWFVCQTNQRQTSSVPSTIGTVIPASDFPATPDAVPE